MKCAKTTKKNEFFSATRMRLSQKHKSAVRENYLNLKRQQILYKTRSGKWKKSKKNQQACMLRIKIERETEREREGETNSITINNKQV